MRRRHRARSRRHRLSSTACATWRGLRRMIPVVAAELPDGWRDLLADYVPASRSEISAEGVDPWRTRRSPSAARVAGRRAAREDVVVEATREHGRRTQDDFDAAPPTRSSRWPSPRLTGPSAQPRDRALSLGAVVCVSRPVHQVSRSSIVGEPHRHEDARPDFRVRSAAAVANASGAGRQRTLTDGSPSIAYLERACLRRAMRPARPLRVPAYSRVTDATWS